MPEIKNTFTQGKMNKDLDERLVPKGQYRDAMNIQVSTSEGSDVGTVQNLLGNTNLFPNNNFPLDSKCVGAIASEKDNCFYWFISQTSKNAILRYKSGIVDFIFIDTNNILKFSKNKLITGINIIGDFLFWTDNDSEPKKININLCKNGTHDTGSYHTRLIVPKRNIGFNHNIEIKEEHITVIKKSPSTILTLDPVYEANIKAKTDVSVGNSWLFKATLTGANYTFSSDKVEVGGEGVIGLGFFNPSDKYFEEGYIVIITNDQDNFVAKIKIIKVHQLFPTLNSGIFNYEMLSIADNGVADATSSFYNAETEDIGKLFDRKFVRFGYRYKFNDGEYSSFSPFTDTLFQPSEFEYNSEEAYNKAMENNLISLKIRNFLTKETPEDVVQIDILYKQSNSPTVYIVDKIKYNGLKTLSVSGQDKNYWSANLYHLTSDLIYSVVSSNQLLRAWDNVPRKALAQEITGNRLVYANYVQNYPMNHTPILEATYNLRYPFNTSQKNRYIGNSTGLPVPDLTPIIPNNYLGQKSIKSLRKYQLGITYLDKYNRETPIFAGVDGIFQVPKTQGSIATRITGQVKSIPPDWAESFKVYVKETSTEYYNLAMSRAYRAEDGNVWLSFPSSERNKIDEETFLILKKQIDINVLVEEEAKYKVLAIDNEPPVYIATERLEIGNIAIDGDTTVANTNAENTFGAYSPTSGSKTFRMQTGPWGGTGQVPLNEIQEQMFVSFRNNTLKEKSHDYEILSVELNGGFYKITLKTVLHNQDAEIIFGSSNSSSLIIQSSVKMLVYKQKLISNSSQFKGMFFVKINSDAIIEKKVLSVLGGDDYQVTCTMPVHYFEDLQADRRLKDTSTIPNITSTHLRYEVSSSMAPLGLNHHNYTSHYAGNLHTFYGGLGLPNIGRSNSEAKWLELLKFGGDANTLFPDNHNFETSGCGETIGGFFIDKAWFAGIQPGGGAKANDPDSIGHNMQQVRDQSSQYMQQGPNNTGFNNNIGSQHIGRHVLALSDDFIDHNTAVWNMYRTNIGEGDQTGRYPNYGKGIFKEDGRYFVEVSFSSIGINEFNGGEPANGNEILWGSTNNTGAFEPLSNKKALSTYTKNYSGANDELRTILNSIKRGGVFKVKGDEGQNIFTIKSVKKFKRYNYVSPWHLRAYFYGFFLGESTSAEYIAVWDKFVHPTNRRMTYRIELDKNMMNIKIDGERINHEDNIGVQKSVSFQFLEQTYIPDPDQKVSQNPSIWETEPKESADLDLYYEASEIMPLHINEKTNESFIPLGSVVTCNARPNAIDGKTFVVGWNDNKITFSKAINIEKYKPSGKDPVRLIFTRPNDSYTTMYIDVASTINDPNYYQGTHTYIVTKNVQNSPFGLSWYNCFSFGNGVESNRIRDDFNQPIIEKGVKVSTVLEENYQEERRSSGLIYSGIYNSDSGVNNLNQFIQAEKITKDLNPSYGSIQKLHSRSTADGDLIAFCEDRVVKILANKDALFNADGNPQLIATNLVLGQATPYTGEFGISTNPESFASDSYRTYFADKQRGAVLRLSRDGLTPISEYGMSDYFKDNLRFSGKIIGSFDDKKNEYNLTLPHIGKTISFKESENGWSSFKSFLPEHGISMSNNYYTFKYSMPYEHHVETDISQNPVERNTFYNIYTPSHVDVLLNDSPGSIKSYKTLNYEGSQSNVNLEATKSETGYYNLKNKDGWHASSITTGGFNYDTEQLGFVSEFIEKEGKWFNFIKGKELNTVDDLKTKEFSFQGVGRVSEFRITYDEYQPIQGCMDPRAANYNFDATIDDGSCYFVHPDDPIVTGGCMDTKASNYNIDATFDDGSCIMTPPDVRGCTNPNAFNFNPNATIENGTCVMPLNGCTDPFALNYNPLANVDDGSCSYYTDDTRGNTGYSITVQDGNDVDNDEEIDDPLGDA